MFYRIILTLLYCLLNFTPILGVEEAYAAITKIRWRDNLPNTRIVLECDEEYEYHISNNNNILSISVDSNSANNNNLDANLNSHHHNISKFTLKKSEFFTVIKFNLAHNIKFKDFILAPGNGYQHRIVIDLTPTNSSKKQPTISKVELIKKTDPQKIQPTEHKPESIALAKAPSVKHAKKFVIMIDPGHGGKDHGARSPNLKLLEKNLTLSFAKMLKQQLVKNKNYEVHLTRYKDQYIRPDDRYRKAEKFKANLLISLHADFHNNSRMRGLSVYTRADHASDQEAADIAEQNNDNHNNKKTTISIKNNNEHNVKDLVNDMIIIQNQNLSSVFAEIVVEELSKNIKLLNKSHRFTNLKVLKSKDMPSVLIELGYLSNPIEERLLNAPEYQNKLVTDLANALHRYYIQNYSN